jgi:hypothetical protein
LPSAAGFRHLGDVALDSQPCRVPARNRGGLTAIVSYVTKEAVMAATVTGAKDVVASAFGV